MNIFKTNKIVQDNEIVAEILRNRRKEKNISLEKVSQEIDIHIKYLKALESGDFSAMPSGVYGKNFLKEYALFLGINYKELLEILDDKNYFSDFGRTCPLKMKVEFTNSNYAALLNFLWSLFSSLCWCLSSFC